MDDQDDLRRPSGQSPRQLMITGLAVTIVSGFLALVFFFGTVLAANPCGAFGDACDDYGTTSNDFFVMLSLTLLAFGAFIAGVVLIVKSHTRRD